MANFVLVHGEHLGGWAWKGVILRLRSAGHVVFAPTLSGCGERGHLISKDLSVRHHIKDVQALMEFQDLRDVILVGHGYGGLVIAGVGNRREDRVDMQVYLDAWLPQDGQSCLDLCPPEYRQALRLRVEEEGDGWYLPPTSPEEMGIPDSGHRDWVRRRLTTHPFHTMEEGVRTHALDPEHGPMCYVHCTEPRFEPLDGMVRSAQTAGVPIRELETGHYPMLSVPRLLAELLGTIAKEREAERTAKPV